MSKPIFSIVIGETAADCRVECNGVDITRVIDHVTIIADVHHVTRVELKVNHGAVAVVTQAGLLASVVIPQDEASSYQAEIVSSKISDDDLAVDPRAVSAVFNDLE